MAVTESQSPQLAQLSAITRALISSSFKRFLNNDDSWKNDLEQARSHCKNIERNAEKLYEVLCRVRDQYSSSLASMCEMLEPTPTTAYPKFAEIAKRLFNSGINWGRIAAMVAFGVHLALYFQNNHMENMVPSVIGWLHRMAETSLLKWLHQHGGWEGFVDHFDPSSTHDVIDQSEHKGVNWRTVGIWSVAIGVVAYMAS